MLARLKGRSRQRAFAGLTSQCLEETGIPSECLYFELETHLKYKKTKVKIKKLHK